MWAENDEFGRKIARAGLLRRGCNPVGRARRVRMALELLQMDTVRHQTPGQDIDFVLAAPEGHQLNVGKIIVIAEKGCLATITPLGDMMRLAEGYDTSDSGHEATLAEPERMEISILSSELPLP